MDTEAGQSTLGNAIQRVFPKGTQFGLSKTEIATPPEEDCPAPPAWTSPPAAPTDIFAIAGYILEESGVFAFYGRSLKRPHKNYPKLGLSRDECIAAERAGEDWSGLVEQQMNEDQSEDSLAAGDGARDGQVMPGLAASLWETLISYWDFPLSYRAYRLHRAGEEQAATRNDQYWWPVALQLYVLADSASDDLGFWSEFSSSFAKIHRQAQFSRIRTAVKEASGEAKNTELSSSLAELADPDVVCVQPKSLPPDVGAGTRVFSKNLSLLRSQGLVRTQWVVPLKADAPDEDNGFNILVIPVPYEYGTNEFDISEITDEAHKKKTRVFRLRQTWLRGDGFQTLCETANALVDKCHSELKRRVHAIVLPELALDQESFLELSKRLKQKAPMLEFFISGTSENCEKHPGEGNFLWIRKFIAGPDGKHGARDGYLDISQSKHHRWRLEAAQIRDYDLGPSVANQVSLSETDHYWENFSGRPREVNFLAFRESSVMCGIICEDLARSEPCHELIRSVGPNIMIALLMDGPQISQRWGARYASLFAEDHGAAVMTVTSRALVSRSQEKRDGDRNYSVVNFRSPAMDKDKSYPCEHPNSGVFLRLTPVESRRLLIDGREKKILDWQLDETESRVITT